jgi:hypothetical protein
VPPETVLVSQDAPPGLSASAATPLVCRVAKARPTGQLVNYVLAADGLELNAIIAAGRDESRPLPGDRVVAVVLTAAIQTTPMEEESCGESLRES